MARGQQAREYEEAESEFLAKKLARMVQDNLEEYQKANKDFPVGFLHLMAFVTLVDG